MQFEADPESLKQHAVPAWFHDAKLGIFIHWGLFSVPGWAPLTGSLNEVIEKEGWEAWFTRNPYAEWYSNSIRIDGSPSQQRHVQTYGSQFRYDDFAPMFNAASAGWDPADWANTFQQAGARYVVLVTKHHDGFLLWPSERSSPFRAGFHVDRDIVGELTAAVRARGMRMGLYYSGGLDWTFNDTPIRDLQTLFAAVPQAPAYAEYATAHWRELIERYQPSVMWNDIGYPAAANVPELFAYYYNTIPDGVINDRFAQGIPQGEPAEGEVISPPAGNHFDFRTPEYTSYDHIMDGKWESTRGLGFSFGFNQNEGPAQHISVESLVRMFVDIVSKNGNLLLNVGPMAGGTIPDLQRERLEGLGAWLSTNGDAIYDTRPWVQAEGRTGDGVPVRYTRKDATLYAVLLDTPQGIEVAIDGLRAAPETTVRLLGGDGELRWRQAGDGLLVTLPGELGSSPAHSLAITPPPELVTKDGA
jgi:alpha-L-fucosidase